MGKIIDSGIIALTLLAPALGGSTQLWAQAILLLGMGAIIVARPPQHLPSKGITITAVGLLLLGAAAFLPASLASWPWRHELSTQYGLTLSGTITAQPWITLEGYFLLLIGIIWAIYLQSHQFELRRKVIFISYAVGIVTLALLALAVYLTKTDFPLWKPLNGPFGFFPNRNHTANVLAIGGLICFSLAYCNYTKKNKVGWLWICAYLIIGVALVINYSRAGILIFFGGSAVWFVWATWAEGRKQDLAIGLSVLLLLMAGFILYGGKTSKRFVGPAESAASPERGMGFRILIQKDAFELYKSAGWHGIGLGNFESVFARYRDASANGYRAVHPESDWLLIGTELGWLAPFLVFLGVGFLFVKDWPRAGEPNFLLRSSAVVAVLMFIAHGFIDVPGHRFGTLMGALLLAALIARKDKTMQRIVRLPIIFRFGMVPLCVVALWWLIPQGAKYNIANSRDIARIKQEIIRSYGEKRHAQIIKLADIGLRHAPLDWWFYFNRGIGKAWVMSDPEEAVRDFHLAYYLEPHYPRLPLEEGQLWASREPELAIKAFQRALLSAPAIQKEDIMNTIIRKMGSDLNLQMNWLKENATNPVIVLKVLAQLRGDQFQEGVSRIMTRSADLDHWSNEQLAEFLNLWESNGKAEELEKFLVDHPKYQKMAWRAMARQKASQKEFQAACEIVLSSVTAPALPVADSSRSEDKLLHAMMFQNDFVAGYSFFLIQMKNQKTNEALRVLEQLTTRPGCPKYLFFVDAELKSKMADWVGAWNSLQEFLASRS
ncbi:MAG: O-antigen ligase family protein [Verrucomicrobiota bacterium]|nr:O-antigen ligase family protein [Verrucomicrobiota bacterium]